MKDKRTVNKILGENIKRVRTEKGVSRKELAEKLGVSEVSISTYENGQKQPPLEKIFSIADFLKVSVASLTGENDYSDNVPNVEKIVGDKIFEYRLQRAYKMARDFIDNLLNAEPNFDKEGRILIHSPKKIIFEKGGTINYIGEHNTVIFKTPEDFVNVMERTEIIALQRQTNFNFAFRHIVFGDELYRVLNN